MSEKELIAMIKEKLDVKVWVDNAEIRVTLLWGTTEIASSHDYYYPPNNDSC